MHCMWVWNLVSRVWLFVSPWTIQSMEFSRPEYWHLPIPGIEPRSSALQEDSSPAEPPGKPKNTEVGSLFLLQGIFLTQEMNWGPLHCRQILFQLSYQGSPQCTEWSMMLKKRYESLRCEAEHRSWVQTTYCAPLFVCCSITGQANV